MRGALAMSLAAHRQDTARPTRLVLPPGSAEEAALVPQAQVYRARHLLDVVARFLPEREPATIQPPPDEEGWTRLAPTARAALPSYPDLVDVKGQVAAKRALEIAAAGGHSLLMVGPPGSGKSMLAQRFAGLLPPMDTLEALESAAVASLAGRFTLDHWGQRPTRSPHHSASAVALVGGGSPPRPGEISLAHQGVLFLVMFKNDTATHNYTYSLKRDRICGWTCLKNRLGTSPFVSRNLVGRLHKSSRPWRTCPSSLTLNLRSIGMVLTT